MNQNQGNTELGTIILICIVVGAAGSCGGLSTVPRFIRRPDPYAVILRVYQKGVARDTEVCGSWLMMLLCWLLAVPVIEAKVSMNAYRALLSHGISAMDALR